MRHAVRIAAVLAACSSAFALSACGSEQISLAKGDPDYRGAELFADRCAGCHTLDAAGTQGSATSAMDKEITDGPNFNQRRETEANVLYALRNGGFSNKIMPQNIVTGSDAQAVAAFLSKYAGRDAANPAAPTRQVTDGGTERGGENPEPGPKEGREGQGGAGGNATTPSDRPIGEGPSWTGETEPDGPVTVEPNGDEVVTPGQGN